MSNQSYSEAAQKVLFKASRDVRKIAGEILADTAAPTAAFTRDGAKWAISAARKYALLSHELENKGHELSVCSNLDDTLNGKSRDAYSAVIDNFEARILQNFPVEDLKAIRDQALGW